MADPDIVKRLAAFPSLAHIPREELEWLVAHGRLEVIEAGTVVAPQGRRIETLWIVLSGRLAVRVDRGVGPRRVAEWRAGDVSGILPYSRMTDSPGDGYLEETSEILMVHEKHFPKLIQRCPVFTAHTVHLMLDRARTFNTSDLQDEKMISLGKLAAGLAHELNNPASATMRDAKMLLAGLAEADSSARALGAAALNVKMMEAIEKTRDACLSNAAGTVLSPIERADREDEIEDWIARHNSDPAHAAALVDTDVSIKDLDALANAISPESLGAALRWIAAHCATHSLAVDIERAATRIYELVAAVKKFTYMDKPAGPESVDVEAGLRDTVRMVAAKARSKGAAIDVEIEPNLPHACATGGELNQVWLNLIDNALDAISESGRIRIKAGKELDRIVVRVIDNGPGIAADIVQRIFDPFFTTKPPGQGTGLGLDVTRRILRRYHGDISLDSRPGRTEFCVSLAAEKPATIPTDQRPG